MNIAEMRGQIKASLDGGIHEWGLLAIVIVVGLISFGLGRLSALEDIKPPISLQEVPLESAPQALSIGGLLVASKTGTAYYYPWCSGAANIKEQNRVWFGNEEEARQAGYAPSKSCKGLPAN